MTTTAMLIVIALCLIGLGLLLINLHLTNKVQRLEKELRSMKDDRIIENANDFVNDFLHKTH